MKLTSQMKKAHKHAMKHDGKLYRHPGGYWRAETIEELAGDPRFGKTFGTSTVQGIVSRGAGFYSDHKEGRNGRFPIEITMKRWDYT